MSEDSGWKTTVTVQHGQRESGPCVIGVAQKTRKIVEPIAEDQTPESVIEAVRARLEAE